MESKTLHAIFLMWLNTKEPYDYLFFSSRRGAQFQKLSWMGTMTHFGPNLMNAIDLTLPPLHQGLPNLSEIQDGIETMQATAIRMLKDARILFLARRYATSATLAAMAITEIARIAPLLELATVRGEAQAKAAWRSLRRPDQAFPWALVEPVAGPAAEAGLNNLVRFLQLAGSRAECIAPGIWISGDRVVRRALAEELLKTAEMVCRRKFDKRVIEIWIKVVNSSAKNAGTRQILEAFRTALALADLPTIELNAEDFENDE